MAFSTARVASAPLPPAPTPRHRDHPLPRLRGCEGGLLGKV